MARPDCGEPADQTQEQDNSQTPREGFAAAHTSDFGLSSISSKLVFLSRHILTHPG